MLRRYPPSDIDADFPEKTSLINIFTGNLDVNSIKQQSWLPSPTVPIVGGQKQTIKPWVFLAKRASRNGSAREWRIHPIHNVKLAQTDQMPDQADSSFYFAVTLYQART
jgi:hypothetical protein